MDVRDDEGDAPMDERREMRQVRAEGGPRLALRTTVRVEDGGRRSPGAPRPIDEARDIAIGPGDTDELRLHELRGGDGEGGSERDPRVAGRDIHRPDLPGLGRSQACEGGARAVR